MLSVVRSSMLQLEKCSVQPAAQMRTYQERSRDMFDYYIFWEPELGSEQSAAGQPSVAGHAGQPGGCD